MYYLCILITVSIHPFNFEQRLLSKCYKYNVSFSFLSSHQFSKKSILMRIYVAKTGEHRGSTTARPTQSTCNCSLIKGSVL